MKCSLLLLIPIALSMLNADESGATSERPAPFSEARTKDKQLDDWITYLGVQPLNDVVKANKAKRAFRLIASSSWTTDVFTVLDVGKREIRSDGRKVESGYLFLLDRAKWENDGQLFSSVRTARALNEDEVLRFVQVVNAASLTKIGKRKGGSPNDLPIDGGCTAFDWLEGERDHVFVHWAEATPKGDNRDLAALVTGFYDLVK